MMTIIRTKLALLTALALVLSLGLVACSDESLTSPADPAPQQSLDEQWQAEVDALRDEIGAEAVSELAPQLEQAREAFDAAAAKDGARFYLSYHDTWFDDVGLYGEGWATVLGHNTFDSDSVTDFSTDPPTQYTTTTFTDDAGDDLTFDSAGPSLINDDFTAVEFYGSAEWIDGTGRYANASGTTYYYGNADFISATGWILVWGALDLGDD